MTIPNRRINIKDGGLGVSKGAGVARVILGPASSGSYNAPAAYTSTADIESDFGHGPVVEAATFEIGAVGGTAVVIRTTASLLGSVSTGTHDITGDGTCTCAGTPNAQYDITIEVLSAGSLGVATFRYALDDGPGDDDPTWSLPIQVPAGTTYELPNTGLTLTFGAGATLHFKAGDKYYFRSTAPAMNASDLADALDALEVYKGEWWWAHPIGEFSASLCVVLDTWLRGLEARHKTRAAIVEVADMDPIGDLTKTGTTPPTVTITGLPRDSWDCQIKIQTGGALGTATFKYSIDGGASWSAVITTTASTGINPLGETGMTATFASGTYTSDNLYTFSTWDKTVTEWIAALQTEFANTTSKRIMRVAGFCELALSDGKVSRRPLAWPVSAMAAATEISVDLGQPEDAGALPGVVSASHDETAHPGLDDAGFCTARTWDKIAGIYVNQPRVSAPAGSDYDLWQYRRVMDVACEALDRAMIKWVNKKLRVSEETGFILEVDARTMEASLGVPVRDAVVVPGHASALQISVSRTDNVLSTRQINVDLNVIGVAYVKDLAATIGYKNPALAVAA